MILLILPKPEAYPGFGRGGTFWHPPPLPLEEEDEFPGGGGHSVIKFLRHFRTRYPKKLKMEIILYNLIF